MSTIMNKTDEMPLGGASAKTQQHRPEHMMSAPTFSFPEFSGKSVLITGASTGIGAALARAFAAQGAKVGLHYNSSREAAETLAREIEGAGGTAVLAHRQGTKPVRCYAPHRFFSDPVRACNGSVMAVLLPCSSNR